MTVADTTTSTITGNRCAWRFRITSSRKYFVEAGRTRPETRLITISPKPTARIPRRGLISARTSGSSFQSNLALAGLPSPLFFFSWRSIRLPMRSTPGLACLPSIPHYTSKLARAAAAQRGRVLCREFGIKCVPAELRARDAATQHSLLGDHGRSWALLDPRDLPSLCPPRFSVFAGLSLLTFCQSIAPSCPAHTRMVDFRHGQEKTNTQEEIREETSKPKKEISPEEKAGAEEVRAKEEGLAPQRARPPLARRSLQSHSFAQPSWTGSRRRRTIRRHSRPLPPGVR